MADQPVHIDTAIPTLGNCAIDNPLPYCHFVGAERQVKLAVSPDDTVEPLDEPMVCSFELAGPRKHIYFDPSKTRIAIVTCGGLCPGINDVIRAIVMEAWHNYAITHCYGIPFGLQGFIESYGHEVLELTPQSVADIYQFGGTILGTSRGPQDPVDIVDALERMNVNILFVIGGDGSMKAARAIQQEVNTREVRISIIGVPKTIDNDVNLVSRSFGFDTAVEKATESIRCAHTEAVGAHNGIGLVKVMGRDSGFIAAQATLALKEVNFVLVPEHRFELDGETGLLMALQRRLAARKHAVILCAEGAGQHLCEKEGEHDASGNLKLADIATVLKDAIGEHFKQEGLDVTLKFIDPSYIIRSVPANANDRVYCGFLGQHAVHAAMAGKTGMVVARLQDHYIHIPLSTVTRGRKTLNIRSDYWRSVLESTGMSHFAPVHYPGDDPSACV